ncbi:hypothetical protein V6Z12_A02G118200 [Gossypium hirsutum]
MMRAEKLNLAVIYLPSNNIFASYSIQAILIKIRNRNIYKCRGKFELLDKEKALPKQRRIAKLEHFHSLQMRITVPVPVPVPVPKPEHIFIFTSTRNQRLEPKPPTHHKDR